MRVTRDVSWRAARRIRVAVVAVVAVAGVLTIHAVFASPATHAARPAAQTVRTSGARVLLAGSSLYSYDVGTRRLQPLPLPLDTPAALLRLLPLRGGTVLVTPGGRVFGANGSHPLKAIGTYTGVLPDHDGDALWLLTPTTAQLSGVNGQHYGKPYAIPTGRRVVTALDAGLVLASAVPGGPGLIDVVDPRTNRNVRSITPLGVVLSAAGDHVAWSSCSGSGCVTKVTTVSTGQTLALPPLPSGYLAVGPPLLSPDNRHYAEPARHLTAGTAGSVGIGGSGGIDLVVGHLATSAGPRESRVAVQQVNAPAGAFQYARDGTLVVDTERGLTVQRPRSRPSSPLGNLPAFTHFAVS